MFRDVVPMEIENKMKNKNPFETSDLSMALSNKKTKMTLQKHDNIIMEPYCYIYKNKVLFTVQVHELPDMELVCQDGSPIPQFIHVMLNDEEIELEKPKNEFDHLNNYKTVPIKMAKNPEFIETYGEIFFTITRLCKDKQFSGNIIVEGERCKHNNDYYSNQHSNQHNDIDDHNIKKIWVTTLTEGIAKIGIIVIEKVTNIEIYDCGFVRVKISENEEYLIKDSFNNMQPFYEIFHVR